MQGRKHALVKTKQHTVSAGHPGGLSCPLQRAYYPVIEFNFFCCGNVYELFFTGAAAKEAKKTLKTTS
jgi:hypothetical protein